MIDEMRWTDGFAHAILIMVMVVTATTDAISYAATQEPHAQSPSMDARVSSWRDGIPHDG